MEPPPRSRSAGTAALMPRKVPVRLTARAPFHWSRVCSSRGAPTAIPALLTRTSRPPNVCRASVTAVRQASASVTSRYT
ncbi:hypothetical protein ABH917_004321 [Thermobifida halotolerans]